MRQEVARLSVKSSLLHVFMSKSVMCHNPFISFITQIMVNESSSSVIFDGFSPQAIILKIYRRKKAAADGSSVIC